MIKTTSLIKQFHLGDQTVNALQDVNLVIESGEYISVMGPSGSGKSTLLNILGLLDVPDSGEYILAGHRVDGLSEVQRAALRQKLIGFVFQSYHLIPRLSAFENIELPLTLARIAPSERRKRVSHLIERLGLGNRQHHLPKQLSGGQRQRVAIARAMIMHPGLLLADEPTGNLDTHSGAEVIELLENLNHEGVTLLIVTHDMDLGKRARRRLRMVDGSIVSDERKS